VTPLRLCGLRNSYTILTTLKNLIDIDIDIHKFGEQSDVLVAYGPLSQTN